MLGAIGLSHYLIVAAILFLIGVFGIFVNRKNVIVILMCVELILLAVNINFVAFSSSYFFPFRIVPYICVLNNLTS